MTAPELFGSIPSFITWLAAELLAICIGLLAHRSAYGASGWMIAAVLARGALVASR